MFIVQATGIFRASLIFMSKARASSCPASFLLVRLGTYPQRRSFQGSQLGEAPKFFRVSLLFVGKAGDIFHD